MNHAAAQNEQRNTLLPDDAASALKIMTQLTRQMLEFSIEEGQSLKEKDTNVLARVQRGKELRVSGYTHAANEFKSRIQDFKGSDDEALGHLEALTKELGKVTKNNQKLIEGMSPKKPLNENMVNNLFLLQGDITDTKTNK